MATIGKVQVALVTGALLNLISKSSMKISFNLLLRDCDFSIDKPMNLYYCRGMKGKTSMKIKSNRSGYTLIELLVCLGFIGTLIVMGLIVYVAWHFISKFW